MNLCRLIYKSVTTAKKMVSNQTLHNLEVESSVANAEHSITGLLVLSGDVYLQVLEGAGRDVTELFGKIIIDKRHQLVELVSFEAVAERFFDDWNMRLVDLHDFPGDKRAVMTSKYVTQDGNIQIPNDVHKVHAFLLDVKHLCDSTPWRNPENPGTKEVSAQDPS